MFEKNDVWRNEELQFVGCGGGRFFANCVMIIVWCWKNVEFERLLGVMCDIFVTCGSQNLLGDFSRKWLGISHSWVLSRKFWRPNCMLGRGWQSQRCGRSSFQRRDLKLNQQFNVRKAVKRDVRCIHASKRGPNLGGVLSCMPTMDQRYQVIAFQV